MKKLFQLLILVLLAGTPLYGQTVRNFTLNAGTQTGPIIDLRGTGVFVHSFTWSTNATVNAGTCSLVGGSDGVTFGSTIIAAETVTSSGGPTATAVSNANYVRITCAAPNTPIAGGGSVQFRYTGTSTAATVGADVNVTNPSLTVTGTVATTNAGTFATQIVQGGNTATVRNLAANDPLNVAIVDGAGDQITTFGGGVQYTEADTDASITGNALLAESLTVANRLDALTTSTAGSTRPLDVLLRATDGSAISNFGAAQAHNSAVGNLTLAGFINDDTPPGCTDGNVCGGRIDDNQLLMTVVSAALPAGNNNIGDVDIASGTLTGITNDVVVTGTGAILAESISVRCVNAANNAFESCAGTGAATDTDDGTVAGGQTVALSGSILYWYNGTNNVRAAETAPIPTRASNGTTFIVDAAAGEPVSSAGVPINCVKDDTPTQADADGDVAYARCNSDGELTVNVDNIVAGNITIAALPNEGQQTMANSISVAIASNQSNVPVSAASGAFASGSIASGAIASGAVASGAYASGAFAVQSFSVGAIPPAAGTLASGVTSAITDTTSTSVIGGTASNYIYITSCVVSNTDADTSTEVALQDGSGGTTLYVLPAPHLTSGSVVAFPVPLKVPTASNALYAAPLTTGSTTKVSCSGFKSTVSY